MGHFILIMYVGMAAHGVTISTAEFNTAKSCEAAGRIFNTLDKGWLAQSSYVCTAK